MRDLEADLRGRHHVREDWDLFTSPGELETVYVHDVDVTPLGGGQYQVKHYDLEGREISTVTVDEEDLRGVLR